MSEAEPSAPDPIDVHVGKLLRAHRQALGFSQEDLGAAIGVSFQQIQKYERATNRMSASKLVEAARVLQIPPGAFFEGLEGEVRDTLFGRFANFLAEPHATRLASAFMRMNPQQQRALVELAETIAPSD
jgi:transcriptional regulator with XRE-family HTH domain